MTTTGCNALRPARPRSRWSRINRQKAMQLIETGAMKPAGLREIERAKADGRWAAAYEPPSTAAIPDDLQGGAGKERRGAGVLRHAGQQEQVRDPPPNSGRQEARNESAAHRQVRRDAERGEEDLSLSRLGTAAAGLARALVGEPEELDRADNIVFRIDRKGDPARVRQRMVGPCASARDEFVAHAAREREVSDVVAVEVAELSAADEKLDASEAVVLDVHVGPRPDFGGDALGGSCGHRPSVRAARCRAQGQFGLGPSAELPSARGLSRPGALPGLFDEHQRIDTVRRASNQAQGRAWKPPDA